MGKNVLKASQVKEDTLQDLDNDTKVQVEESSDEDKIRFDTAGSERMIIDESGNVGIGTSSPDYNLDVAGTVGVDEYIYHNGDGDTLIRFQDDNITLKAGNVNFIELLEDASQDKLICNNGGDDLDFIVRSPNENLALYLNAGNEVFHINHGESNFKTKIHTDHGEGITVNDSGVIINEDGHASNDFRVESDGEDEAVFLDASSNTLYINKGSTSFTTIMKNNNEEAFRIGAAGIIFNEYGHATNDLRVESDNDTHIIFVDSGNDRVGVGSSSPAEKLDVTTASSSNTEVQFNIVNTNAHETNGSAGISATLYQDNSSPVVASKILTVKGAATWDAGDNPAAAMEFWLRSAADQALRKIMTLTSNGGMRFNTDIDTGSSGAVLFQDEAPIFRVDSTVTSNKPSFQMHRGATNTHGATGTGLSDGTALGGMQWFGTDTSDYVQGGSILAMADGAWSASGHPLKLNFNISGNTGSAVTMMMLEGSTGRLGFKPAGGPNPLYPFHIEANAAGWAMGLENLGDDNGRYGLRVQCGKYDNSGTNYAFQIRDGDGTAQGNITFSGGTVTYGAFTGDHYVSLNSGATGYDYGTIMKIVSTNPTPYLKTVSYLCEPSSGSKDKSVLGVYSSHFRDADDVDLQNLHSVFSLGDGHILVCNEGGNIEIGDYICSSNTLGHGMKQDDDLLHNYTIAKSSESVIWNNESSTTKLIACTYHCG